MDMMSAIIIGTVFCALIVSLFMVAFRYNAMSRELKAIGSILRKQVKAQSSVTAQILERMDEQKQAESSGGKPHETSPAQSAEVVRIFEQLKKLETHLDELASLWAEHLDAWHAGTVIETIPPHPHEHVEPAEEKPVEEPDPHTAKAQMTLAVDDGDAAAAPEDFKKPDSHQPDKTVVRCPSCARQLPYDALKIQDEQTCPYCQEVFRSNTYLLSLINERQNTRTSKPS